MLPTRISIQDQEYRDPDTGQLFDRESLNAELEKIEKPAGISNPKISATRLLTSVLRARANNSDAIRTGPAMKTAHGYREENVLQYRGVVAGYLV